MLTLHAAARVSPVVFYLNETDPPPSLTDCSWHLLVQKLPQYLHWLFRDCCLRQVGWLWYTTLSSSQAIGESASFLCVLTPAQISCLYTSLGVLVTSPIEDTPKLSFELAVTAHLGGGWGGGRGGYCDEPQHGIFKVEGFAAWAQAKLNPWGELNNIRNTNWVLINQTCCYTYSVHQSQCWCIYVGCVALSSSACFSFDNVNVL